MRDCGRRLARSSEAPPEFLIASASNPAVMIKTNVNGHSFEEVHSDGGSASPLLAMLATGMRSAWLHNSIIA